jgi:hypothetical protein
MSDAITLSARYSFWLSYRANMALIRFMPLSMVALALAPAYVLYMYYPEIVETGHVRLTHVIAFVFALAIYPVLAVLMLFLARQRNAFARGPFTFAFSDEGMHVEGEAVSSNTKWPAVLRVAESRSFMFFFVATRRAQVLPTQSISEQTLAQIRALVVKHVKGKHRFKHGA